jgi:hypothetical protein
MLRLQQGKLVFGADADLEVLQLISCTLPLQGCNSLEEFGFPEEELDFSGKRPSQTECSFPASQRGHDDTF